MKKLITNTLLGLSLIACQNNKSKINEDAKIQKLEEKIEQLTETKLEVEREKVEVLKPKNDPNNNQIEKLRAKYKYLRAKFLSTDEGDLFYYNFKDEKGKVYTFTYIKDKSYELLIDDETSNFGQGINPKYRNKYFDIFYQVEKLDLMDWGVKEDVDVIMKMILVE